MSRDHDPTMCAAVGHRYWTWTAIYCPHRQAYTLRRTTYVETGTLSDPVDYDYEAAEFGPFDTVIEVQAALLAWVSDPQPALGLPTPRLPG